MKSDHTHHLAHCFQFINMYSLHDGHNINTYRPNHVCHPM